MYIFQNFNLTVKVDELEEKQTLKIRLLPGNFFKFLSVELTSVWLHAFSFSFRKTLLKFIPW